MQAQILYRPSYSMATVDLEPYEEIDVEPGAMVSMTTGMTLKTQTGGKGLFKSLTRSLLGGESFFTNRFQAPAGGGQINLAPTMPGDMMILDLRGEALLVQSGAYVASSAMIDMDVTLGGAKTFFASEGLFMLRARGEGLLFLASYGAIHPIDLIPNQSYTVDTGHLVAFSEGMGFRVHPVGGLRSTLFSGEGLVVDLTGPGRVYMQTRSEDAFLSWLIPNLSSPQDE